MVTTRMGVRLRVRTEEVEASGTREGRACPSSECEHGVATNVNSNAGANQSNNEGK